jgi:hypothetical protein
VLSLASTALFLSTADASTLANLSARGLVGSTAGSLVAGLVVDGSVPKNILLRGVGPGLAAFGVGNHAAPLVLNVYDAGGALVATNSGYQNDPAADNVALVTASVGAFALSDPGDSATVAVLAPGAYSVELVPADSAAPDGAALLEVYDADAPSVPSKLRNLSTRSLVGANAGPLVSGFVINGHASKTLLIRAVGPDLANFGVPNAAGPVDIYIYNSSGKLIAVNSGYQNVANTNALVSAAAQLGAFPLNDPGDSAVLVTLPPGAYSVVVVPTVPGTPDGVGLVEVYDLVNTPPPDP